MIVATIGLRGKFLSPTGALRLFPFLPLYHYPCHWQCIISRRIEFSFVRRRTVAETALSVSAGFGLPGVEKS